MLVNVGSIVLIMAMLTIDQSKCKKNGSIKCNSNRILMKMGVNYIINENKTCKVRMRLPIRTQFITLNGDVLCTKKRKREIHFKCYIVTAFQREMSRNVEFRFQSKSCHKKSTFTISSLSVINASNPCQDQVLFQQNLLKKLHSRDRNKRTTTTEEGCQKVSHNVKLRDLEWKDGVIHFPDKIDAHECIGECSSLTCNKHLGHTKREYFARSECYCVPTKMSPHSILYYVAEEDYLYKEDVPEMIVQSCGCSNSTF